MVGKEGSTSSIRSEESSVKEENGLRSGPRKSYLAEHAM